MEKINVDELKELFIEIKHNNNIAFEKLYNKYNKLVYGIAFCILKNKNDAEDIVQLVFTKIYSIDKDKLPIKNEANWLYTITKNETITFLRKHKNNISLEDIYEIEDSNNEINKIINQDSYNRLINKLNEKEKEIISLRILSNLSFEEIGKVLNIPTGTVKWRYYKAIHTLKILFSNLGMCIVTFITSVVAFRNGTKLTEDSIMQENKEDSELSTDEDIKGSPSVDADTEKKENTILDNTDSEVQENIIVETPIIHNNTNYVGIGFMGISGIFFVTTIVFAIIFAKYQLKGIRKASK